MSEVTLSLSLCMRHFVCIYTCINLKRIIVNFLKWTKYSILVALLILVELGCAAFLFFDKSWKEVSKILHGYLWSEIEGIWVILQFFFSFQEIPTDKTGDFDMIYGFLRENWDIVRWVALGIVIFEVNKKLFDWHLKEINVALHSYMRLCPACC